MASRNRLSSFFGQAEHKIKVRDGGVHRLVSHRDHALCHPEANVVGDRKARARPRIEAGEKFLDGRSGGESDVAPDREQDEEAGRICLLRIDAGNYRPVRCEAGEAALNFARGHMRLQLGEKAFLNLRFSLSISGLGTPVCTHALRF